MGHDTQVDQVNFIRVKVSTNYSFSKTREANC